METKNLNGKVIVIDGVSYKLVAMSESEAPNKVIISMLTPFGAIQQVVNRYDKQGNVFPLAEGKYEEDGHEFTIEYATEAEVKQKVGKPMDELSDDERLITMLGMLAELGDEK